MSNLKKSALKLTKNEYAPFRNLKNRYEIEGLHDIHLEGLSKINAKKKITH